jgi:hypothetical protein
MHSTRVDGNALAGMLEGLLGSDPTAMIVTCGGCGAVAPMAELAVELDDVCGIVLCRTCTHTLFTVMRVGDGIRITFGSLHSLSSI